MAFTSFTHQITPVSSVAHIASYYRCTRIHKEGRSITILVLLHGFPQNNLMWKYFVDEIPPEWTMFVPDLPSYGENTKQPSPSGDSLAHSEKQWAKDILEAIDIVHGDNSSKIIPYGHDRGARLAYRLALDFPQRIAGVGALDIVPTSYVWNAMKLGGEHKETKCNWHWIFLSSPSPFPETLISSQVEWFFTELIGRWAGSGARDVTGWVSDSVKPYTDPSLGKAKIIGSCEDYRAGATYDLQHDLESGLDPTNPACVFQVPLLVLSSAHISRRFSVDKIWQALAPDGLVKSLQIGDDTIGHFLVNEAQEQVGEITREWLRNYWG